MRFFSKTDVGVKREMNQDYVYASMQPVGNLPNLFIVADGMGGHNAGDYASRYAVETIVQEAERDFGSEPREILQEAIQKANERLIEEASENIQLKGMGTTAVAAVISGNRLTVANIGDSRLYLISGGLMYQVTKDHSLVEELVRRGQLGEEEARTHPKRNIITRAIGVEMGANIDIFEMEMGNRDVVLLCSDGLTNMVTDQEIHRISSGPGGLSERGTELIDTANYNGGRDNITVLLIEPFAEEAGLC